MKIGIDAMGGDNAPFEIVKGAVESLDAISGDIILFGREADVSRELAKYTYDKSRVSVVNAEEVIEAEDKPVQAIKSKKDSSMVVGMTMLREKKIDAFVSAGNTGALLAGSLLKVGRIKGIDRPAIASPYPTSKGLSVLTDAGANADCKPRNLLEFAIMGSIYCEKAFGTPRPKVGILNIGSEKGKGSELVKESYDLLEKSSYPINFTGNVEAREISDGAVDVIVADGFTGNIVLKLSEGVAKSLTGEVKKAFMKNALTKISALLVKNSMNDMKKRLDYTEYGGAPLLGVDGLVIKAHGSSNSKALMNAIRYAERCVETSVVESIREAISAGREAGREEKAE